MIRYGSIDETATQPCTERSRPLLPRPRASVDESASARPPAA
jgi:hypothetical protein